MSSPLLPYANAYVLVESLGATTVVSGRITTSAGTKYLVQCYLTKQISTGTETGGEYRPLRASPGSNLPGASGDIYLYRGYALRFAQVASGYALGDTIPTTGWTDLVSTTKPVWLKAGITVQHQQGSEPISSECIIEDVAGRYGGAGIDQIVSISVGGIPLVIRSGNIKR